MNDLSYSPVVRVLALLVFCACGDDGAPRYESSCERACARAHDCSSAVNVDTCVSDCKGNLGAVGPKLSDAYLSGLDSCLAKRSCNQLVATNVLGSCQDEAKALLAPSATAQALCDRVVASFQECAGLSVAATGCLGNVKIFNDGTLQSASSCDQKPCAQRVACLRDMLGVDPSQS